MKIALFFLFICCIFSIRFLDANNSLPSHIILSEAINFHKTGKLEQAIQKYELFLLESVTEGTRSQAHINLGALYLQKGDNELAKSHFESAVRLSPENSQVHYNLAILYTSKFANHRKALSHCAKSLKFDSNHKTMHLMAVIYQNLGREKEAQQYYSLAEQMATITEQETLMKSDSLPHFGLSILPILNLKVGDFIEIPFHIPSTSSPPSFSLGSPPIPNLEVPTSEFLKLNSTLTLTCLSTSPYIFQIDQFLSDEECQHILKRAKEHGLEKSFVMGKGEREEYRSSSNTWLSFDPTLSLIQSRLSRLLSLPLPYLQLHSEELQVVRYRPPEPLSEPFPVGDVCGQDSGICEREEKGGTQIKREETVRGGEREGSPSDSLSAEQFLPHQDSSHFHPRLLTALFYLTSPSSDSRSGSGVSGGETWFPFAPDRTQLDGEERDDSRPGSVSEAVESANRLRSSLPLSPSLPDSLPGLLVRPQRGRAVIFFNHHPLSSTSLSKTSPVDSDVNEESIFRPSLSPDPLAVHAGLPLLRSLRIKMEKKTRVEERSG